MRVVGLFDGRSGMTFLASSHYNPALQQTSLHKQPSCAPVHRHTPLDYRRTVQYLSIPTFLDEAIRVATFTGRRVSGRMTWVALDLPPGCQNAVAAMLYSATFAPRSLGIRRRFLSPAAKDSLPSHVRRRITGKLRDPPAAERAKANQIEGHLGALHSPIISTARRSLAVRGSLQVAGRAVASSS